MNGHDWGGRLPTFMIAGAMRCGTTSLNAYLREHPQVAMSTTKEIRYFGPEYGRGLDWYRSHFTTDPDAVAVGEATPHYLFEPEAPARIAATLPEARLVILLRNPIDRAYSHYWHDRARAKVETPFDEVVTAELAGEPYSYLAKGRYGEQLDRLYAAIDPDRVLVETFEDLSADPGAVLDSVCRFIGVDDGFRPALLGRPVNAYTTFRSLRVRNLTKSMPRGLARVVGRLNQHRVTGYPPMRPDTRGRLASVFADANAGLPDLVGRPLPTWD